MRQVLYIFLIAVSISGCQKASLPHVKEGDIIFQTSKSSQSQAIQLATKSKYSHMGIVLYQDEQPCIFEAVEPVKFTPLREWINRGENHRYVVKRLKNAESMLAPTIVAKMHDLAAVFQGKHYDLQFAWSDSQMYCSELVWKLYQRSLGIQIGKLQALKDFDLTSPIVQRKLKERYGDKIPYDEAVISPQAIFDSEFLQTVASIQ